MRDDMIEKMDNKFIKDITIFFSLIIIIFIINLSFYWKNKKFFSFSLKVLFISFFN